MWHIMPVSHGIISSEIDDRADKERLEGLEIKQIQKGNGRGEGGMVGKA